MQGSTLMLQWNSLSLKLFQLTVNDLMVEPWSFRGNCDADKYSLMLPELWVRTELKQRQSWLLSLILKSLIQMYWFQGCNSLGCNASFSSLPHKNGCLFIISTLFINLLTIILMKNVLSVNERKFWRFSDVYFFHLQPKDIQLPAWGEERNQELSKKI